MDTDYKKLYSELFIAEMNHLVGLVVEYAAAKDFNVADFKMYWDHDGLSPMITDSLEDIIKRDNCPEEIKAQVEILRKHWQNNS